MSMESEILQQLRELRGKVDGLCDDVTQCRIDVAELRTRNRVWDSLKGLGMGGAGAGVVEMILSALGKK